MAQDITELLQRWSQGDAEAFRELTPLVYQELRKIAYAQFRNEPDGLPVQPTEIVHEAYFRMAGRSTGNWKNRAQFYALASQVIRRILIDHARARLRTKRGGSGGTLTLDTSIDFPVEHSLRLTALDDALQALAKLDARQSQIVELRFFAGLSMEEIAEVTGLSLATVKRAWGSARAWLLRELETARDE